MAGLAAFSLRSRPPRRHRHYTKRKSSTLATFQSILIGTLTDLIFLLRVRVEAHCDIVVLAEIDQLGRSDLGFVHEFILLLFLELSGEGLFLLRKLAVATREEHLGDRVLLLGGEQVLAGRSLRQPAKKGPILAQFFVR